MITKAESSDLHSLIQCAEQAALGLQTARLYDEQAKAKLEAYLWKLQQAS
jgi:hypothetical protein